jgi:hypothetical protein
MSSLRKGPYPGPARACLGSRHAGAAGPGVKNDKGFCAMNKAITDGLVFMPPAFENGLDVWSSGDGTPGSPTYDGAANAALVVADQDFSS